MVVGFEKMFPGRLQSMYKDRVYPIGTSMEMMQETRGTTDAPGTAQLFGNAGQEYMEKYILPPIPQCPMSWTPSQLNSSSNI